MAAPGLHAEESHRKEAFKVFKRAVAVPTNNSQSPQTRSKKVELSTKKVEVPTKETEVSTNKVEVSAKVNEVSMEKIKVSAKAIKDISKTGTLHVSRDRHGGEGHEGLTTNKTL